MNRKLGLVTIGFAILVVSALANPVHANPWTYHHCPKSSYSPLHYWAPSLYTAKAYLQKNPPFLYSVDRHPEIPYDFNFQRFPCPATYPQTLYSFPQLDHPPVPKPVDPGSQ